MSKTLGTIGFRKRGDWQPETWYRADDAVNYGRSLRYAKEDHTSGEEFDESKWGFIADATGVGEATQLAKENAERAEAASEAAETQANAAQQAAEDANREAEAAREVTEVFSDHIKVVPVSGYLYAIVDSEGSLLWGIREDGTVYQPKGIPEETLARLKKIKGMELMESPQYLFAITDGEGNMVFAIDHKGASVVNSLKGVCTVEQFDGNEFLFAVMDTAGNLLFGVKHDGTFHASKFMLPESILKQIQAASASCSSYDEKDNEFIYKITDKDGLIVFAVRWDGILYMPKGMSEEQKKQNRRFDKRISALENMLANFKGGTGDWSDNGEMRIPIPRLGIVNILSNKMPTAKSGLGTPGVNCDIPCQIEFWDRQGNYAKIWTLMSAQGNSSMAFVKKNLAFDLFTDKNMDEEFVIKFGDWVPQDSFHLKAYYTDAFRGVGVCSYMLYDEIMATRGITDNAPYKEAFANKYDTVANENQSNDDLTENFDTGARCYPAGFPVAVYQNGEFYGIYSWQLKKHRDNFHMNKKTAEHIHLDGTLTPENLWSGSINWTGFEVRNPKSLLNVDGTDYDGDHTKEIMGTDAPTYDKSDKNMKRCATAKQYIIDLSKRIGEIRNKETELGRSTIQSQLNSLTTNHTHSSSTGLSAMTSIAFVGRDEWLVYLTKDDNNTNDATLVAWLQARQAAANAVEGFNSLNIADIDMTKCVKIYDGSNYVDSSVWQNLLSECGLDGYTLDFNGETGRVYPTDKHISLAPASSSRCYLKIVNVHNLIEGMDNYLASCDITMRTLIDKYFNVSFCIDYLIHAQIINNADGFNKNWQWTTWDGVRWTPNPYDLDMSFGGHFIGNITTAPPTGWVGNSTSTPMGWVIRYFLDDIKARYAILRNLGLFNPEHVAGLVQNWVLRIGEDLFEQEYEKWAESPCNRDSNINSKYWKRTSIYTTFTEWNAGTTYAAGGTCSEGGVIWRSKVANNIGNKPSEDGGDNWERFSYDADKSYKTGDSCCHGMSYQWRFECVKDCEGQPPFKAFYQNYPREMGYYDSPYRVLKWLQTRIGYVDSIMEYEPTIIDGVADINVTAIPAATILNIINS